VMMLSLRTYLILINQDQIVNSLSPASKYAMNVSGLKNHYKNVESVVVL